MLTVSIRRLDAESFSLLPEPHKHIILQLLDLPLDHLLDSLGVVKHKEHPFDVGLEDI